MKHFFLLLFLILCSAPITTILAAEPVKTESTSIEEWRKDVENPHEMEESHFAAIFVRMILMLGITLLLAVLIIWVAKRFMHGRQLGSNTISRLKIIERQQLSPKAALYLISIDKEEFLVGESVTGINVIKTKSEHN